MMRMISMVNDFVLLLSSVESYCYFLRMLADQAERALKDTQAQLARKDADLRSTEEHTQALEDQLSALRRASQSDRDEITRLRSAISKLDQEKDDLQNAIDDKTEQEVRKMETMTSKVD